MDMEEVILVDGKVFKCPSKFKWKKSDVSGSKAGRDDSTLMHKDKKGEKRQLSLGWVQLSKQQIHEILVAFSPEYVDVTYWDPLIGTDVTKNFYTGDMEAEVKTWVRGKERYSTLNFDVVER